jgi:DNA transposition AAA+ family ATPase
VTGITADIAGYNYIGKINNKKNYVNCYALKIAVKPAKTLL